MSLLLTISLAIASLLPQADDTFWRDSIPTETHMENNISVSHGQHSPIPSFHSSEPTVTV